ncbi:MAG: hypothetical protein WBP93_23645 [Pyrinomonadaceae bacterium]
MTDFPLNRTYLIRENSKRVYIRPRPRGYCIGTLYPKDHFFLKYISPHGYAWGWAFGHFNGPGWITARTKHHHILIEDKHIVHPHPGGHIGEHTFLPFHSSGHAETHPEDKDPHDHNHPLLTVSVEITNDNVHLYGNFNPKTHKLTDHYPFVLYKEMHGRPMHVGWRYTTPGLPGHPDHRVCMVRYDLEDIWAFIKRKHIETPQRNRHKIGEPRIFGNP